MFVFVLTVTCSDRNGWLGDKRATKMDNFCKKFHVNQCLSLFCMWLFYFVQKECIKYETMWLGTEKLKNEQKFWSICQVCIMLLPLISLTAFHSPKFQNLTLTCIQYIIFITGVCYLCRVHGFLST